MSKPSPVHAKTSARIRKCVDWHTKNYHHKWRRFIDLYAVRPYDDSESSQERVAVGVAFAIVNVIVPAISHNYPRILVRPMREDNENSSVVVEAVINQKWRELKVRDEIRDATKDAVILGTGIVKTGWRRAVKDRPRNPATVKAEYDGRRAQRDEARTEYEASNRPDLVRSLPTDEDVWLSIPQTEPIIEEDDLFVERVSPMDVFVDPDSTGPRTIKYLVQRIRKPLSDVKNNPAFDEEARRGLKSSATSSMYTTADVVEGAVKDDCPDDVQQVELYEYWDVVEKTYAVYAKDVEKPLLGPKPWPYRTLPFFFFRDNTIPDEFWAMGEVEAIESQNLELNKTRSQMLNQRRQYNRKVIFKETAFQAQHIDELRSDQDGVFVPVKSNIPLADAILILTPPAIDAQLYQVDDTIRRDITEVSSVSEYQRGQLPGIRRTATEASLIESAASIRAQDKLSRVEGFMAEVARGMLELMMEFYTEERVVRVEGPDKARLWFSYNSDLIAGEYDLEVEAGSSQPQNDALRKQEAIDMMGIFVGHPNINQLELVKHVLRTFRVPSVERFLQELPQVDPMAMLGGAPAEGGGELGGPPPGQEGPPADGGEGVPAPPGAGGKELDDLLNQLVGQVGVNV